MLLHSYSESKVFSATKLDLTLVWFTVLWSELPRHNWTKVIYLGRELNIMEVGLSMELWVWHCLSWVLPAKRFSTLHYGRTNMSILNFSHFMWVLKITCLYGFHKIIHKYTHILIDTSIHVCMHTYISFWFHFIMAWIIIFSTIIPHLHLCNIQVASNGCSGILEGVSSMPALSGVEE